MTRSILIEVHAYEGFGFGKHDDLFYWSFTLGWLSVLVYRGSLTEKIEKLSYEVIKLRSEIRSHRIQTHDALTRVRKAGF
jgi:hypothetical protein